MAGFWRQTRYLVHRNFLIKWRNKRELFQEVLLPMLLLLNLATIRYSTQPETQEAIPSFPPIDLFSDIFTFTLRKPIGVTPNTEEVKSLLALAAASNPLQLKFEYFENETLLLEAKENSNLTGHGIVFMDNFPDDLSYTIRTDKDLLASTGDAFTNGGACRNLGGLNQPPTFNCPATGYLYSGFSPLQVIIDHAIILMKTNLSISDEPLPEVITEMFPKDEYPGSPTALQTTTAIYFVLAYSPFIIVLLAKIVSEKEKKLTQQMKMMGMRTGPFWTAWFIVYAIMIGGVSIFGIGFGKAIQVFPDGNFFLLWLLLMLYGISIVNMAFMMTPFFNKAVTAGAVGGFLAFLMAVAYIPFGLVSGIPVAVKWVMCIFSPIAVSFALDSAVLLEIEHDGLRFDSLGLSEFPVYASFIMLAVDALFYFILAVYFDNVIPSEYGQRKDPLFCFRPSYWKNEKAANTEAQHLLYQNRDIIRKENEHEEDVEEVPPDVKRRQCIRVDNIVKEFPGTKTKPPVKAVNGISLEIYEGQITCLLGHNGAGKSTLVNCLTGMMPSTSGLATIYGLDVTDSIQMDTIRMMTGVCQQENTLFDYLSPREHLTIYAGLKGIPVENIEQIVDDILKEVDLEKQGATHAKDLSGGQKRKLCMGVALIGDPKVVILDEPTSGMDPYSRRSIWTLLKNKREGRIILLTTHFMDEADILADRKAIISNGKLRCFGSSLFLKNRFGIGYKLGMVTDIDANHDAVKDVVVSTVIGAKVIRSHGMELSFQLPLKDVELFAELFRELESTEDDSVEKSKKLGIQSYGVSMTTLEEVFLKIGEEAEMEKEREQGGLVNEATDADVTGTNINGVNLEDEQAASQNTIINVPETVLDSTTLATHPIKPTFKAQFKSVLNICFLLVLRNPSTYVVRFILPNIYMAVGVVMVLVIPSGVNDGLNPIKVDLPRDLYLQNLSGFPETKTELLYQNSTGASLNDLVSQFDLLDLRSSSATNLSTLLKNAPHHQAVNVKNLNTFSFVVHYNDTAIHSLPILINILMNSLYGLQDDEVGNISVSTQDFPSKNTNDYTFNGAILLAIFFAISLNMIPPYFAVDKVKDRQLKTRAQLRVSGITMNTYWLAWLTIDVAFYALACLIGLIIILAFRVDALMTGGAITTFLLLLVVYLPVSTVVAYCISFLFENFESCQAVLPSIYSLIPTAFAVPTIILDLTGSSGIAGALHILFSFIFPPYAIYGGIYYIVKVYEFALLTQTADDIVFGDYFKFDAYIIPTILILLFDMVYMYFFLRWCEIMKTGGDWRDAFFLSTEIQYSKINKDIIDDEDEDVIEERERVDDILQNNKPTSLVISGLRREFVNRKDKKTKTRDNSNIKVAVRNVSLSVSPGEVFGLLGPNGAGKTSLLNVVTADIEPTKGQVRVGMNDIASSLSEAYQTMGYCPQVDPLWPDLTMREHLNAYGVIKGLCLEDAKAVGNHYMEGLKIMEHADKKVKEISGGTKRKLCFALSMLGNPEIILMDEPSTGMDPSSKRFLWNTIIACFQETRGGVLTTHSMEEADAVCSRVGIMVSGQLKCLGTTQHLKDKYGGGYLLEAKLNMSVFVSDEEDTTTLLENKLTSFIQHVRTFFPGAEVIECFSERVTIKVPRDEVTSLAKVFEIMQEGKSDFAIEEYSFSQSTLEQVFIEFAKHQDELEADDEPREEAEIHRSHRVQPKPQRQFSSMSANSA